ncbi:MbnP family protein [Polaribacter sp.]|uniref:MbnP family protein n=1 Tax=Polaribacter sp. TaxID=1920175 RepID=UPI0035C8192D
MIKRITYLVLVSVLFLTGCKDEKDCCVFPEEIITTLNFTHNWNGKEITNQELNELKFTTENGEKISIERLRYLISNLSLVGGDNQFLIDFGENSGTNISLTDISPGTYNLKFTFGLQDIANKDGEYQLLNSVNFNVPAMLGGGYHYMQFDGKFLNNNDEETGFNFHAIRAVDRTNPNDLKFEDTSFEVDLGTVEIVKNTTIEIKMDVSEWFKTPNTWNLNELHTVLMPNFEAQKMISENGKSVFTLGKIN